MATWNRDEEWVLQRFRDDRAKLRVTLSNGVPLSRQLADLRRCFPPLQLISPAKLQERIGPSGIIDLGEMAGREAIAIANRLQQCGIHCEREAKSVVNYLPVNKTRKVAWIIEDPQEADAIIREMISAGVPIEDTEA